MKKILEAALGLSIALSIVLAGGEKPDGTCDPWWTISWISIAVILGLIWKRYFTAKPVHITDDAYIELQKQIQDEVDRMTYETHRTIEIEADLPNDSAIYLTIEMLASSSQYRFADDAWGFPKSFTETNWRCLCEITKVSVLNDKGREVDSDFDSSNLELEFETTDWK